MSAHRSLTKSSFMQIVCKLLLIIAFLFGIMPFDASATEVKRKVLVLFDSSTGQTVRENHFVEGFAMPLNYLGFLYEIHDINGFSYPEGPDMDRFGAVITVFSEDSMAEPERYLSWLVKQQDSGKKVVITGSLGAYRNRDGQQVSEELIKRVYSGLGFSWLGNATNDRMKLNYAEVDKKWMNFERKLPIFPPAYAHIVPENEAVNTWVGVERKGITDSTGAVVATGPGGGLAMTGFIRWQDPVNYLKQWYINPFEFLRQSLGVEGVPSLTPTTLNGLRVAFAHIDGDGFAGYTEIDKNKNCGEIVMERIFARYDFPNSASVIAGEINPDVRGSLDNVELARELFEMENIETSSHSYTHPYAWNAKLRESKEYAEDFVVGQYEKPGYEFDAHYEIVGSCDYISEDLAPPEKPCKVLFWSGMCDPTQEQVAIADKAGILNLNGGDSVMDARRDSYFGVSPLYRELGKYSQIYTGQANENILTNLWTGPFFGFRNIIETMERTGSPRRIMPIDIYYHFYSGEKFASLKALEDVYEWVLSQDCAKIYASAYIKMVRGYLTGRVEKINAERFTVSNYGNCLSLRLDGKDRIPDLRRCSNVLGYDVRPEGVFVHLRPGEERAELVLATDKQINRNFLYVRNGSGWVIDFQRTEVGARFVFDCFSTGRLSLGGLVPNAGYRVVRKNASSVELESDGNGVLEIGNITSGPVEIVRI